MIQTRNAAMDALLVKWEKNARHFDDYRGILMCIRELKEVLAVPEVPTPAITQDLMMRTTEWLMKVKGTPFFTGPEAITLVTDLLNALRAITPKPSGCVHDLRARLAGKSYHAICEKCKLDAGLIDMSNIVSIMGNYTPPLGVKVGG